MTALLLNGSPHHAGHTMRLAEAVFTACGCPYETIHLFDMAIRPCIDCGTCTNTPVCPLTDDMSALREKLDRARIVVVASPLHFTSLTAPVIALYSRLQPYWHAPRRDVPIPHRKGGLVLTAGGEYRNMFEPARAITAAALRTLHIAFTGMATASRTDHTSIAANPDALESATSLGRLIS